MIVRTKIPDKSSGIYMISSTLNGKQYIGSSVDLKKRIFSQHLTALKNKKHYNIHLQRHINKYGIDDLWFGVLEICPREKLIEREQYYINFLKPKFNINPNAKSCFGRIQSDEERKKRKILWSDLNFRKIVGEKMKKSHKDFSGKNHPNFGKKFDKRILSEEEKQRKKEYQKEYSKKYSREHWKEYYQTHTKERKQYYELNREKFREYRKRYQIINKEDISKKRKEKYRRNKIL